MREPNPSNPTWHAFAERMVFGHFWTILGCGGAVAEWILACWLLAPTGVRVPLAVHLVGPPGLALLNRFAGRRYEREPAAGMFAGRTGAVIVACALGAIVGLGALTATAALWSALRAIGALRVEAGGMMLATGEPWLGGGFRMAGTTVLALTWATLAHGYTRGYRRLGVTERALDLPGLGAPLRVVHVSDFHLGPLADRAALRSAIDRTNALDADLVCVTGDLVDSRATDLDRWLPELARLSARHGVYAILGNHDRHADPDRVAAALRRTTDWRLLRDEIATVTVGAARLHIVGFEDRPEPLVAEGLSALLARVPTDAPTILLVHHPRVFATAAAAGVPLTLAGHTHGGQFAVPGIPRFNLARLLGLGFDAGVFRRNGSCLVVSRGLGTSGQRVRVAVPCEIAVLTLVPAA